ncbi:hypothetical protein PRIPAC_71231 [Pristionchus pacificus]|uniref:CC domain-containing protein n=1 Tax=Pristionchus pacificus TaxID=54126 RepID=A0A454Y5G1_PRIPA|nr:hypothetical protein PRIPAC_71231 [Pristionchus pacificus]|eukprot:PDM80635.1 hypothetical protein PRIPAC_35638 [Pristionchus pacificus]
MQLTILFVLPFFVSAALTNDELKGSIGDCIAGVCPSGYSCKEKVCIAASSSSTSTCAKDFGMCIAGVCPSGSSCVNGQCCASATAPSSSSCDDSLVVGQCMEGLCPPGYSCKGDKCCPK